MYTIYIFDNERETRQSLPIINVKVFNISIKVFFNYECIRKLAELGQAKEVMALTWPMFNFERTNHRVA
jgi:hypothetical protein